MEYETRTLSAPPPLCISRHQLETLGGSRGSREEEGVALTLRKKKKKNFGLWLGRERKIVDVKYCMRSSGNK